jgi:hypothetical protein
LAADAGVPGRAWYWAAAAVAAAATAAVVGLIAWLIAAFDLEPFLVPGRHTVEVARTGDYLVWNDYRTFFKGRTYDAPEKLPDGIRITVVEASSGRALSVSPAAGASMTTDTTSRVSIASYTVEKPGRYEISVSGPLEPRVFSTGRDIALAMFAVMFGSIGLLLGGYGAAVGIAVWTYIRRDLAAPAPGRK